MHHMGPVIQPRPLCLHSSSLGAVRGTTCTQTHHPLHMLRAGSRTGWERMEQEQGPWQHRLCPQGMGKPGGQCPGICTPGRDSLQTEHTHQRRSRQAQRFQTCITEMEKHHRARRAEREGGEQISEQAVGSTGGTKEQGRGQRSSKREQEGRDSTNRGKAPDLRERAPISPSTQERSDALALRRM